MASTVAGSVEFLEHDDISINIENQDLGLIYVGEVTPEADDTANAASGLGTVGTPTSLPQALTGTVAGSFGADWYNRIHVIPGLIELGNFTEVVQVDVEVWNAYFIQQTLTSIDEQDTQGLSLIKPFGEPAVYDPLQDETYTMEATPDGPAVVDAVFTFNFGAGGAPDLIVTGERVVIFPYSPQRPVSEGLEFLTDILEGYEGTEQRAMVRNLARQFYSMAYRPGQGIETATMLNTFFGHLGRTFAVPLFQFERTLLADAAINDTSIILDTTFADFREGGLVILWRSPTDFESTEIDTVDPGQLNLARPLEQNHTAGDTMVIPMQLCFASDPVASPRKANGVTRVEVNWRAIDVGDLSADDGDLTIYKSAPVIGDFNFLPGGGDLEETTVAKATIIDNDTGVEEVLPRRIAPEVTTVKTWDSDDPQKSWETRQLIYALRGRQRSFWLPSFRVDFIVAETIGAADVDIEVVPVEYDRFIDGQSPYNHIAIYLNDGTIFFREVISAVPAVSGNEQLNIDLALGQEVLPSEILRVSYLVKSRLNADRIEFEHRRSGSVRVSAPVVGVIQ